MVTSKFLHLTSLSICTTSWSTYKLLSLPDFFYAAPSLETLVLNVSYCHFFADAADYLVELLIRVCH
jgi:hypothetical protein